MAVKITTKIIGNTLLAKASSIKADIQGAMQKGLYEGGDELRDYIKNELLSGQLVNVRTSQFRNSLWVQRGKDRLILRFRGMHTRPGDPQNDIPNSVLAEILDQGLTANGVRWKGTKNAWHPGIKPRYFIRKGLQDKRKRIVKLVEYQIGAVIRKRRLG